MLYTLLLSATWYQSGYEASDIDGGAKFSSPCTTKLSTTDRITEEASDTTVRDAPVLEAGSAGSIP